MRFVTITSIVVNFALLMVAANARAGAADTDSLACGSSPAGFNAPNGALVLARTKGGMVAPTLSAIGENYSHSMLSHGAGGWVSHATMYTPGTTGWPTYCSTPLKPAELKSGYPGASQTNQGGLYSFLYLDGEGLEQILYQRSKHNGVFDDTGLMVANYLWSIIPYEVDYSKSNGGQFIYRLKHHGNLAVLPYVLYQYRNSENENTGQAAWNNGTVCSTFLAYAQYMAGQGTITNATYNHAKTVVAGNALYNSIESKCNTDTDFLTDAGATISCFEGICDDAARQARNCMARGVCDSDDNSYWNAVKNDASAVSISISPDRLGGWSGHPYLGAGVSVWAEDVGSELVWNSGGSVYGCWY